MIKSAHLSLLMMLLAGIVFSAMTLVQPLDTYVVDTGASKAEWKARKVTGEHFGSVFFKSGNLDIKGKTITGGAFEMDMTTMTVEDIQGSMAEKLLGRLKSDDFFSVETHPYAKFVITSVKQKDQSGGYSLTGNMTIKGITQPLTFDAQATTSPSEVKATGKLKIDRTKFDIRYRSTNFFENLGDKAIYDDFELAVTLVAKK